MNALDRYNEISLTARSRKYKKALLGLPKLVTMPMAAFSNTGPLLE